MTLPEHVVCSVMLAQFGVQQRFGWRGVIIVALSGIAPDIDTVAKLVNDREFWRLHHALGHNLLSILLLATVVSAFGRYVWGLRPIGYLWLWCVLAGIAHSCTDALFWWGVQLFWPLSRWELCLQWIEYLDLAVLAIWLVGAFCLYRFPSERVWIARATLAIFATYVFLRAVLPPPTGIVRFITGGWMYSAPSGTPVLDWW